MLGRYSFAIFLVHMPLFIGLVLVGFGKLEGSAVVIYPARALRISSKDPGGLLPELLADPGRVRRRQREGPGRRVVLHDAGGGHRREPLADVPLGQLRALEVVRVRSRRGGECPSEIVDPGVLLHLMGSLGMTVPEVTRLLYHESGLKGLSGISSDMRDLEQSADPHAAAAINYFVYAIQKQLGAVIGVDADLALATRGIRRAGVAEVMRGTIMLHEARFSNVDELLRAIRTVYMGQRYITHLLATRMAMDGVDEEKSPFDALSERELQVALMLRSARELLSVGVTTARDLGARGYLDLSVRQAVRDGTARGPRLLTSGSPITVTGRGPANSPTRTSDAAASPAFPT